jgi:integrase/recombinase XerC
MAGATIKQAIDSFLLNIQMSKGENWKDNNTYKNYKSDLLGVSGFLPILAGHGIKPATSAAQLSEAMASQFLQDLLNNGASVATRQRKAAAVREFFRYAIARDFAPQISIEKLNFQIKSGKLLIGKKNHVDFPMRKVEKILEYVKTVRPAIYPNELEIRRNMAFIYTLAETGLRVGSACSLRVYDIDPKNKSALIIGKGDKQQVVYFGSTSWKYVQAYMKIRGIALDRESPLPLFTRHDKSAHKKSPKPITEETAESIIHELAYEALGEIEYTHKITCHTFRHYFVTTVLDKTGDLKKAQDLAHHENIITTARYAHRTSRQNHDVHSSIFGKEE